MRTFARSAIAALVVSVVVLVVAPAAMARLGLRVLGSQPGDRFGADQVYNGFGCTGRNLSPALRISNVPAQAKSLAITIHDPDAATQSGWWHWLVYDLPVGTTRLAEGAGARPRRRASRRCPAGAERLRRARLRRGLPAGRRPPTSLPGDRMGAQGTQARRAHDGVRRVDRLPG
jgi:hypothetical protein